MKIRELSILLCSLAIALPAFAQEQEKAPAPAPAKEKMQCPAKIKARILKKYDKDGDGKLNDAECAELRKVMQQKMAKREEFCKKRVARVLEKFDKDGDKKLDETEIRAFLDEQRRVFERMRMRPMMPHRKLPKEVIAKFDKNGDGVLDRQERAEMIKQGIQRRAELLKKYDKDGDGKFNDEERAELLKDPSVQKSLNCVMDSLRNRPWPPPRKFYRKAHRMGPVLPSHPGAMKGPRLAPPPPPAKCPQCGAPVPPPPPAE